MERHGLKKASKVLLAVGIAVLLAGISVSVIGGVFPRFGEFLPGNPIRIGAGIAAFGILPLLLGLAVLTAVILRHQFINRPEINVRQAIDREYAALVSSGALRELPASWPVTKKLAGKIGACPIVIQLTFTSGGEATHWVERTEFHAPFSDSLNPDFQLRPTGTKVEAAWDVEQAFARMFYVDGKEAEAFGRSGFDRSAMQAVVNFQMRHGEGLMTVGPGGVTWSVARLDFGGRGDEIVREFAKTAQAVRSALAKKGSLDLDPSVAEEGLRTVSRNPPVFASGKQLIAIFSVLSVVGLGSLLGGLALDEAAEEFKLALYIIAGFTLVPGLIGMPLLLYHLLTSRPAIKQ